jgi:hypothetical protein
MFDFFKKATSSARIKVAYERLIVEMEKRQKNAIKLREDFAKAVLGNSANSPNESQSKLLYTYVAKEAGISIPLLQLKSDFARFQRQISQMEDFDFDTKLAENQLSILIDGDKSGFLGQAFLKEYDANMLEIRSTMKSAE